MRVRWCGSLWLAAILLSLSACGPADFSVAAGNIREAFQRIAAGLPAPTPPDATAALRQKIRRQLEAEDFCSALSLLRKEIKGGLPETALADEYGRAVNGVLAQAKQYREQGMTEKAGELLRSARDGFPETKAVAKKVSLTPPEIQTRMDDCAAELMERGLVAYRSGDLDEAIRTWKAIHTFNPRHQASLKALKTAEVQRTNLEKVETQK